MVGSSSLESLVMGNSSLPDKGLVTELVIYRDFTIFVIHDLQHTQLQGLLGGTSAILIISNSPSSPHRAVLSKHLLFGFALQIQGRDRSPSLLLVTALNI